MSPGEINLVAMPAFQKRDVVSLFKKNLNSFSSFTRAKQNLSDSLGLEESIRELTQRFHSGSPVEIFCASRLKLSCFFLFAMAEFTTFGRYYFDCLRLFYSIVPVGMFFKVIFQYLSFWMEAWVSSVSLVMASHHSVSFTVARCVYEHQYCFSLCSWIEDIFWMLYCPTQKILRQNKKSSKKTFVRVGEEL